MNAQTPRGGYKPVGRVESVATPTGEPLYEAARRVYPQSVRGFYRRLKWIALLAGLGIYYFLPFVRWDRGPNEPSQAVLVDLANRRFYFFFIELWPQEVYHFTGLLIIAAFTLFLLNALAGRVWCGYLCPQTVWTDLFMMIERLVEGDRRERMAKDQGPWTLERVTEKVLKHSMWLLIAWWTGGAWVLYFSDAPTLVRELATFSADPIAYIWIGILTFTTYLLAGFMREQVCLYMCPWPRIQAALTDENALNVTYRADRGEPRMSLKKAAAARARSEPAGDCVECNQCVAVCPTGVDIRQGASLGCIQCGLCIDACDTVMRKVGRPERLIAYDTDVNIKRRREGLAPIYNLVRPRTILYVGLIATVAGTMLYALLTRGDLNVAAIHDRNPLFTRLSTGDIRDAYTIRLTNKLTTSRDLRLSVSGLPDARLEILGVAADGSSGVVTIGPDQTREVRALVTTATPLAARSTPIVFTLSDAPRGATAVAHDFFDAPGQ